MHPNPIHFDETIHKNKVLQNQALNMDDGLKWSLNSERVFHACFSLACSWLYTTTFSSQETSMLNITVNSKTRDTFKSTWKLFCYHKLPAEGPFILFACSTV